MPLNRQTKGSRIGTPAAPVVRFAPQAAGEFQPFRRWLDEAIAIGTKSLRACSVGIDHVLVSKFVSMDVPGYMEYVITWYCDEPDDRLARLPAVVAEAVGAWANAQDDLAGSALADRLSTEVLPLRFAKHV